MREVPWWVGNESRPARVVSWLSYRWYLVRRRAWMLVQSYESVWDDAERNTIDEIICRVHPDGGDAIHAFWEWYEPQASKWIGPHRAAGAWLAMAVREPNV